MRKNFLIVILVALSFTIFPFKNYALDEIGEEVKLYLGEVKILAVNTPIRIIIANPNVVDVTTVTKSEITLNPKSAGVTTLVVVDNFGEQSYRVKVLAENLTETKRRIDNLLAKLKLPEVRTQAEEEEGKILLLGRVKKAEDKQKIDLMLGKLKEKTLDLVEVKEEEAVVEIDVQVLELNTDATKELGFTWPGSLTLTDSSGPVTTAVTGLDKVFHVSDFTRSAFSVSLNALIQEGKARVLSRPRLTCQSGKEAELKVGGEVPIFTTEYVASTGGTAGQTTGVDYKEYGIILKIKPTVSDDERVKLTLNVEVSEVGTVETLGTTARAYPISKRTVSTEVFLNNEQILAIGGLIKQKSSEDLRKTPWLSDLPLVGLLFRKKTVNIGGGTGQRGNTELFITLTPTIIGEKKASLKQEKEEIQPEVTSAPIPGAPAENLPVDSVAGYSQIVQKNILENLSYPASAKQSGFQGTVKLSLLVSYKGELLELKIKDSSGYQVLDDQAVSAAKGISYPPFPPNLKQENLWIDVPIAYRLD